MHKIVFPTFKDLHIPKAGPRGAPFLLARLPPDDLGGRLLRALQEAQLLDALALFA